MSIPESIKTAELLSWVDVARRLSYVASTGEDDSPPPDVVSSEAYWSGLIIRLKATGNEQAVRDWLQCLFGSWLVNAHGDDIHLRLAAPEGMKELPVHLTRIPDGAEKLTTYRPHASLEGERYFGTCFPPRPEQPQPPIFAFHSVKGGVGRTTSAIAFSLEHGGLDNRRPTLLVDADFEAPGISFLSRTRKNDPTISLEDLLALAHADRTENFSATLDFVVNRMADQRAGTLYILPVKRLLQDLSGFAIRPENLLSARPNKTYVVVDLIRELAHRLGCRMAVVDLRAGLVDIAVQFLTDPTVERVFVSTAGGQSVSAIKSMISTLGLIEKQTGISGRRPFILFNQLPLFRITDSKFRGDLINNLLQRAETSFLPTETGQETEDSSISFGFIQHITDLLATASDWDAYIKELEATTFPRLLMNEMRGWSGLDALAFTLAPSCITEVSRQSDHSDRCRKLQEFSERLEVAESASTVSQPLVTPPLQRLASDFLSQVPIVIVEGAKGTGKTLTYRYLLERNNWRDAVRELDTTLSSSFVGPFLPLFGSVASNDLLLELVTTARTYCTNALQGTVPRKLSETAQNLKGRLLQSEGGASWLQFWLSEIAAASGHYGEGAWDRFVEQARLAEIRPVVLVEGLEEILTDPFSDPAQSRALLSLLREVPLRLREEAGRPIGFVAFVRADMVEATIIQNLAQFRSGYANYTLTWRDVDIKELVIWLASNSGAIPDIWSSTWRQDRSVDEQEQDLRNIWGRKLGTDESNEARSTEWVIAVLTDLTGRLTARDLVRFIGSAAKNSRDQSSPDRLLAATALKKAVQHTSRMKVKEYPNEVRQLGSIFRKFTEHPGFETPIDRQRAAGIGIIGSDLDTLEKYGVAYQEDGIFEVPELFRIGLEMKRAGARPNIISLTRRARERAKA